MSEYKQRMRSGRRRRGRMTMTMPLTKAEDSHPSMHFRRNALGRYHLASSFIRILVTLGCRKIGPYKLTNDHDRSIKMKFDQCSQLICHSWTHCSEKKKLLGL